MSKSNPYEQVREFHKAFGHPYNNKPTPMDKDTAISRSVWKAEEIVEFLYATVAGDKVEFTKLVDELHEGINQAMNKELDENKTIDDVLVAQADALTDISYFNNGSFTIIGVEPQPLFDIVQNANMGKLWEDGKPRFREEDGKIVKPPNWEQDFAPEPLLKKEIERQKNSTNK